MLTYLKGAILQMGFEMVAEIMKRHYDTIAQNFFVEGVNCLAIFANNKAHPDVRLLPIILCK